MGILCGDDILYRLFVEDGLFVEDAVLVELLKWVFLVLSSILDPVLIDVTLR
jgi:hypothetical protein